MGELSDQDTVRRIVANVWADVLPWEPMREELIWSEAGVDSLKSLQILQRIEQLLGRRLSFDLFAREQTLGDLIRSLAAGDSADEPVRPDRRTLFLAPGIFGDEPRLADLRRALRGHVACNTLQLPELDQPTAVLSDLAATVRPLVRHIVRSQPEGPIAIAGYSFGSLVAYQAALELRGAGRTVDLLCLIDTAPPSQATEVAPEAPASARRSAFSRLGAVPRNLAAQPGEGPYLYVERILYRLLMLTRQFGLARRLVAHNMRRYDFERGRVRRRHLLEIFRRRAMRSWRPATYDGRVLVIESDDLHDRGLTQHWTHWCPDLDVAVVGGDHLTIFDPAPLARLVPALVGALGLAAPDTFPELATA